MSWKTNTGNKTDPYRQKSKVWHHAIRGVSIQSTTTTASLLESQPRTSRRFGLKTIRAGSCLLYSGEDQELWNSWLSGLLHGGWIDKTERVKLYTRFWNIAVCVTKPIQRMKSWIGATRPRVLTQKQQVYQSDQTIQSVLIHFSYGSVSVKSRPDYTFCKLGQHLHTTVYRLLLLEGNEGTTPVQNGRLLRQHGNIHTKSELNAFLQRKKTRDTSFAHTYRHNKTLKTLFTIVRRQTKMKNHFWKTDSYKARILYKISGVGREKKPPR